MSAVIKLIGSDPQLMRLLRDTGLPLRLCAARRARGSCARERRTAVGARRRLARSGEFPAGAGVGQAPASDDSVLLVVPALDPALMLEAMRAGVNEIVAASDFRFRLHTAIKRLVGSQTPAVRGEVFAFVGAKGGVGTTTIAVNVASALAKPGAEATLLIDLNTVCGDAAVFLGARAAVLGHGRAGQRAAPGRRAISAGSSRARSSGWISSAHRVGRPRPRSTPAAMRTLLEFAGQSYRYTVLDVPRSDATRARRARRRDEDRAGRQSGARHGQERAAAWRRHCASGTARRV